jgi:hypothetical protein
MQRPPKPKTVGSNPTRIANYGVVQSMPVIVINGKRIESPSGSNLSVINGVVKIDGVTVESGLLGVVKVEWEGPLANLQSDASVTCGDVAGNVSAGGSVHSGNIQGSVTAGGSVHADDINGSVNAGGSVNCRSHRPR